MSAILTKQAVRAALFTIQQPHMAKAGQSPKLGVRAVVSDTLVG